MKTFLSTSQHLTFLPMKIRNKSIFWWFDKFGVLKATSNSLFGKLIQKRGDQIFVFELKYAIRNGDVAIKERTIGVKENKVIFKTKNFLDEDNKFWLTGLK